MPNDLDIPMPRMAPSDGGYRGRMRATIDRSTRRLALIAGGIAAVLLLLVGVWSVSGHHRGGVPVVEADARPWRTKPDKLAVLLPEGQDDAGSGTADALAPPPEVPAPQALKAEAKPTDMPTVAAVAPAPPVIAPPVLAPPVATPPVVAAPPIAAPAAVAAPATPVAGALVQLGALDSEQAAMTEWQRLEHRMPDLLSSRRPEVSKAEHAGRTYFRLRTGGFNDIAEATAFCGQIRAKGTVCTLARS